MFKTVFLQKSNSLPLKQQCCWPSLLQESLQEFRRFCKLVQKFTRASLFRTVSRYLNTTSDNYSYQGQSKLTQQDARNKWLEGNPLDPVVQDRIWLAATAAGAQPPSATPSAECSKTAFQQSLTGNLCSGNQDCTKLLLTECQKPLTKCFLELQKELLYILHFTNTLIPLDPLNGCPKTCFPLNYFQLTPTVAESSHRQLYSYRTQSLPLFPCSDYFDCKHTDFIEVLHVWYVLYLPHLQVTFLV